MRKQLEEGMHNASQLGYRYSSSCEAQKEVI